MTASGLSRPLPLPCGATLPNRIAKSAMTEGLADSMNRATERHARLYSVWGSGGAGLHVTGNVQIDRRFLERAGNVAFGGDGDVDAAAIPPLQSFAAAGRADGAHVWMQISHAGRQTPKHIWPYSLGPSAVPVQGRAANYCAPPRAMTEAEIKDVQRRFTRAARTAKEAGFSGVQLHSAHGYLLSSFLSPIANQRSDRWGGALPNRARLLRDTVRDVRAAVGPSYPVAVKLNSSDFQTGGFSLEECCQVVEWLGEDGVDLLEISGGTYERPAMMNGTDGQGAEALPQRPSTRQREAYFLEYARVVQQAARMPLMVTGGFRSRRFMEAALDGGELDVVGLARPLCLSPDAPRQLIDGTVERVEGYEEHAVLWFYAQLYRLADGLAPDAALSADEGAQIHRARERESAGALLDRGP